MLVMLLIHLLMVVTRLLKRNSLNNDFIYHMGTIYSIAEYSVDNSTIKPTYMLTYESASELLHLNLEEEAELKILSEAAALRLRWRRSQVGRNTF